MGHRQAQLGRTEELDREASLEVGDTMGRMGSRAPLVLEDLSVTAVRQEIQVFRVLQALRANQEVRDLARIVKDQDKVAQVLRPRYKYSLPRHSNNRVTQKPR